MSQWLVRFEAYLAGRWTIDQMRTLLSFFAIAVALSGLLIAATWPDRRALGGTICAGGIGSLLGVLWWGYFVLK